MAEDNIEAIVGYISGNARRKQIVEALSKGAEDIEALGKLTRIPRLSLEKMMEEMTGKNIVKTENKAYKLTDVGEQAATVLKSLH
jgi:predicted transcriptional regulator